MFFVATEQVVNCLVVKFAVHPVNLLGDLCGSFLDTAGDLGFERLTVKSVLHYGLEVGLLSGIDADHVSWGAHVSYSPADNILVNGELE
jgi:hypothetical protein